MNLENKRVMVTGGSGFLGRVLVEKLEKKGSEIVIPRSRDFDLVDYRACRRCFNYTQPNIVIHSAAFYGGIWINKLYPAKIYYKNLVMGANMIEMCRLFNVEKFVGVGTACSYPGYLEGELEESDLWAGPCHESVRNYGMTKKMLQVQCEAYRKQYGLNGIHLILTNLYGEWDTYNPNRSHVVAALVRKFVEAKKFGHKTVEVWGTGKPIREFLYVRDAAEAIIKATEVYDELEPMNIGTGVGTSIEQLVSTIVHLTKYDGKLTWNTEKPDGQMKKILDVSKMKEILGWQPETTLTEGLQATIRWFEGNYDEAIKRW